LRLGWLATCGVPDPLGSGWPLFAGVEVVDPWPVEVVVVFPEAVVVVVPLVVVGVPWAVVVVTGRVVVVVVEGGTVVVVGLGVVVVVVAPPTPASPTRTAMVTMAVPVVRRRCHLTRCPSRSRISASVPGEAGARPVVRVDLSCFSSIVR
jgi:hypothetical protein